jgi:threonine/homoserine/homoserine lactone efflux protein
MGRAIVDVLPVAAAIAVFPVPLIAVVLILGSEGGRGKGAAFALAWLAGLATAGVVVLLVAGEVDVSDGGEPKPWVDGVLIALGVVLVALAVKGWLGRPRSDEEAPTPRWMRSIDRFTVRRAAAAGFGLSALNPKNVLLVFAAATEIAGAGLPAGQRVAVLAVFVLVASAGVLAPLVYSAVAGERSRGPLDRLRAWMERWNVVIMSLLFLAIGLKLIVDAISGLS